MSIKPVLRKIRDSIYRPYANKLKYNINLKRGGSNYEFDNKQDILILSIDCLRSDHTSLSGYDRETTPFMNSVGLNFPNTISAAPWTFPSVPSILSGLYPHSHGATFEEDLRNMDGESTPNGIDKDVSTLGDVLGKEDYSTYFSTAVATALLPIQGRFRDIEIKNNDPADEMVNSFLDWWTDNDSPKFGYIQLGDLHEPINEPDMKPFGDISNIDGLDGWRFKEEIRPESKFKKYREERILLYDTALRFIDSEIKRLFSKLESLGDLENLLVIITGDHGEEFWEHADYERENIYDPRGYYGVGHGHSLFQEVINVPLVLYGFEDININSKQRVSTVDIAPTILDKLGHPPQSLEELDGESLLGEELSNRPILSEGIAYGYDMKAVFYKDKKLIYSEHDDINCIFDLDSDPSETECIDDHEDELGLFKYLPQGSNVGDEIDIGENTQNQLEELGYL